MERKRLGFAIAAIALVVIFALPFRFTSILATKSDRQQALDLTMNLHRRMSDGDIDGIYNDSDRGFKANFMLAHHRAFFSAIARKLGSPMNCQQDVTQVEYGLGTKKLRTWCRTRFSKDSTGTETVVWVRRNDGQYRLYFYWLNSDDLVIR